MVLCWTGLLSWTSSTNTVSSTFTFNSGVSSVNLVLAGGGGSSGGQAFYNQTSGGRGGSGKITVINNVLSSTQLLEISNVIVGSTGIRGIGYNGGTSTFQSPTPNKYSYTVAGGLAGQNSEGSFLAGDGGDSTNTRRVGMYYVPYVGGVGGLTRGGGDGGSTSDGSDGGSGSASGDAGGTGETHFGVDMGYRGAGGEYNNSTGFTAFNASIGYCMLQVYF